RERKFLGFPVRAVVCRKEKISFCNRPNLVSIGGNFHGLSRLAGQRIDADGFPVGSLVVGNEHAAGSRCVPGRVAEYHIIYEVSGKLRNWFFRHGRCRGRAFLCFRGLRRCRRNRVGYIQAGPCPLFGRFVIFRPAAVGEGSPPAVWRRINVTQVGALQPWAKGGPGSSTIFGGEESVIVER